MSPGPFLIGIDLSGPSNPGATVLVVFESQGTFLNLQHFIESAGDEQILQTLSRLPQHTPKIIGLDAPLSYQPGGGDREGDRVLRAKLTAAGLPSGTVMTPTMTRMAFLTLRGMAVARILESLPGTAPRILEVHPAGALCLHGAPLEAVLNLKRERGARRTLLDWLGSAGMAGLSSLPADSDHLIAACAAAFTAWRWYKGKSAWCFPAAPPLHPYPIVC